MTPNRLRWGAVAWLATLQFFVAETVVQLRHPGPYSRSADVISALGSAASPGAALMNASFVVQGALILGGAVLLRPALSERAAPAATALLATAAVGVFLVGVFPLDGNGTLHAFGAVLYFAGGGLGLIALAYAVRPRSELVGTLLALAGLVATAATVLFLAGVTRLLGNGGTERAAAYVLPLALALTGIALLRLGPRAAAQARDDRPSRRELRAAARAEREARERERDEALEAAVRRGGPTATDSGGEPEDPWAPVRR